MDLLQPVRPVIYEYCDSFLLFFFFFSFVRNLGVDSREYRGSAFHRAAGEKGTRAGKLSEERETVKKSCTRELVKRSKDRWPPRNLAVSFPLKYLLFRHALTFSPTSPPFLSRREKYFARFLLLLS